MPDPGRRHGFVALDGPNGVGKTSAVSALGDLLKARRVPFTAVRQPQRHRAGQFIRRGEERYQISAEAADLMKREEARVLRRSTVEGDAAAVATRIDEAIRTIEAIAAGVTRNPYY